MAGWKPAYSGRGGVHGPVGARVVAACWISRDGTRQECCRLLPLFETRSAFSIGSARCVKQRLLYRITRLAQSRASACSGRRGATAPQRSRWSSAHWYAWYAMYAGIRCSLPSRAAFSCPSVIFDGMEGVSERPRALLRMRIDGSDRRCRTQKTGGEPQENRKNSVPRCRLLVSCVSHTEIVATVGTVVFRAPQRLGRGGA